MPYAVIIIIQYIQYHFKKPKEVINEHLDLEDPFNLNVNHDVKIIKRSMKRKFKCISITIQSAGKK